jgi:NADH/NAD ratio-sensing transcriptional regulator Rex
MANELIKNRVAVVWNRRPEVLLKKQGIMVLGAFKVHLTPEIKKLLYHQCN